MAVTVVTSQSWFSRLGNSVIGSLIGLLLVIGMVGMLFWNEGRAVKTAKALAEGAGAVVTVDAKAVDPANEGKLIAIAGPATPQGVPEDALLGIRAEGAVALERSVEMYQWKETQKSETRTKLGGGTEAVTTYDYVMEWSSSPENSSNFKEPAGHQNPQFPVRGEDFEVPTVTVGAFAIDGGNVAHLGARSPLVPDAGAPQRVAQALGAGRPATLAGDTVFVGFSPSNPRIGDMRVKFTRADLKELSVAGAQAGNGIKAWTSSNGREIFLAKAGIAPAAELFADAIASNTVLTWILRVVGLVLMLIGFSLMFAILGVIGDVIPFVGSIVRAGTGLIALFLTAILGSVTIAIAWIFFRPLIGLAIIAIGFAIAFAAGKMGAKKGAAAPPAGTAA
ncbi:MAG: TMEM43 family protein [Phyllobacteriaceae bacterium]|nr:TMEM43 family protein [Phyllobacteriaceae bacterium]